MTGSRDDAAVPAGFAVLYADEPFEMHAGPHYFREHDGDLVAGLRARPVHANAGGVVHGGALTAFADSAPARNSRHGQVRHGGYRPTG